MELHHVVDIVYSFFAQESEPQPRRRSKRLKKYTSPVSAPARSAKPSISRSAARSQALSRSRSAKSRAAEVGDQLQAFFSSEAFQAALVEMEGRGVKQASVYSWEKDGDWIAKEFADVYAKASNLPHEMEDELNALPLHARNASGMQRKAFEAHIRLAERNLKAPPIQILNPVDDDLTPPIEFHYTDLMYHTDNVPRPNFDGLKGCGCRGSCDPLSKTCSCVAKQLSFTSEFTKLFRMIYTEQGTLHSVEFPVIECNAKCGCDEECQNRVRTYIFELTNDAFSLIMVGIGRTTRQTGCD